MKRFQTKLRKNCDKNWTWGENYFLGKIMLEIILTKTKVVSTRSDNSRMRNLTFSIKNVKNLCWPAPLARWSYQSLGQAQNFPSEIAPVIKHERKIKNKSWLFLIWEIIKKITHYYFNKKIPINNCRLRENWIEKNMKNNFHSWRY